MFCKVNMRIMNSGQHREVWFIFWSEFETMREIHEAMVRESSLFGIRYETKKVSETGWREVVDEYETIIGEGSIVSIIEMQEGLIDKDGRPLWSPDLGEIVEAAE